MKKYWITTISSKNMNRDIIELMCNECDIERITMKLAVIGSAAYYDNYQSIPPVEMV